MRNSCFASKLTCRDTQAEENCTVRRCPHHLLVCLVVVRKKVSSCGIKQTRRVSPYRWSRKPPQETCGGYACPAQSLAKLRSHYKKLAKAIPCSAGTPRGHRRVQAFIHLVNKLASKQHPSVSPLVVHVERHITRYQRGVILWLSVILETTSASQIANQTGKEERDKYHQGESQLC